MDRYLTVVLCSIHLLTASVLSRDHHRNHRHQMAFMDSSSYYGSCCFVDLFCYAACFSDDSSLRSLVPADTYGGRFHTSETRHSRRHHRHRHRTSFRTKRDAVDNILWQKLRQNFAGTKTTRASRLVHAGT